jgi:hypothetical protein
MDGVNTAGTRFLQIEPEVKIDRIFGSVFHPAKLLNR